MLKQRILTAILLLALLVPSVFYSSPLPFAVITLVLVACGAWEWSRLNGSQYAAAVVHGLVCGALGVAIWFSGWLDLRLGVLWSVAGTLWVLMGAWLLRYGQARWTAVPLQIRLWGGLLALLVAWMAVMQARAIGINFLFSVFALVWVADIAAYFSGRGLGGKLFRNKLAPSISPGKTWEGALGGAVGVVVCAFAWIALEHRTGPASMSLYARLESVGYGFLLVSVLFLTAMSVVGDLVESLFKRLAGVKDSSALLPGHGGVLDRLDALIPTLPLAMMIATLGTP
jgi:phosphatidate cytidylyltransferase